MQSTTNNTFHVPAAGSSSASTSASLLGGSVSVSGKNDHCFDLKSHNNNDHFSKKNGIVPFDGASASAYASASASASGPASVSIVTPRDSGTPPTLSSSSSSSSVTSLVHSAPSKTKTNDNNIPTIPSFHPSQVTNNPSLDEVLKNGLQAPPALIAQPNSKKRGHGVISGIQASAGHPLSLRSAPSYPQVTSTGLLPTHTIDPEQQDRRSAGLITTLLQSYSSGAGSPQSYEARSVQRAAKRSKNRGSPVDEPNVKLSLLTFAAAYVHDAGDINNDSSSNNNVEENGGYSEYDPSTLEKIWRGSRSIFNKPTEELHQKLIMELPEVNPGRNDSFEEDGVEEFTDAEEKIPEKVVVGRKKPKVMGGADDVEDEEDDVDNDNGSAEELECVAVFKDADGWPVSLKTTTDGISGISVAHQFLRKKILQLKHEELPKNKNEVLRPKKAARGKVALADATHQACIACMGCGEVMHRPPSLGEQDFYIGIMKQFRIHVKDCPEVPEADKMEYKRLQKAFKTRGKKIAWPNTARAIHLTEMIDENGHPSGITYLPPNGPPTKSPPKK